MTKIAFQGEHGAYSEMAVHKHFGKDVSTLPCKEFRDVFNAVKRGKAAFGVIPVENSTVGDINENYDLLLEFNLKVSGEECLRVRHCLLASKGVALSKVRKVYSHPQALAQCAFFLRKHRIEAVAVYDTAGAAAMVKSRKNSEEAAIASELAAEIYSLKILRKGIESVKGNTTRFFIISNEESVKSARMKTSILFVTEHKPGALYNCLGGFASNNLNITKLVSRPMKFVRWEYVFYLDFQGSVMDAPVKAALEELGRHTKFLRILGSYPEGAG